MKAAKINSYGGPEVLIVNDDAPQPEPHAGQVLVEVHAASINPVDWKVRAGYFQQMVPLQFPVTLGGDIAGIVSKVGENVTEFAVGDKVYGQASMLGGNSGAFAEFAVTSPTQLAKIPEGVEFSIAASLPLTALSALQVLQNLLKLQSGQKILIHGGAGGIGTIAIQLAKHIGAYVATTASGANLDYVKELRADEVINYQEQQFEEMLHDYDAVFDTVGGETYEKSFKVLKKGGIIASMVVPPNEELAKEYGVTALMQGTQTNTTDLDTISKFVTEGVIKPNIAATYALDQIQEAFKAQEGGGVRGKVVVEIKQ